MPYVQPTLFEGFLAAIYRGEINCDTETWKFVLTNTAPDVETDVVYADLSGDLSTGGGYTNGGLAVTVTLTMTDGLPTLTMSELSFDSSADVGPFRYGVLRTVTSDNLACLYDYGSSDTLNTADDPFVVPEHVFHRQVAA